MSVAKLFSRRGILRVGLGAVGAAIIAACTKATTPDATGTSPGTSAPTTPSGTGSTPAQLNCVVTPQETEGPFFVDERLNRSDIRPDPANGDVSEGAILRLNVRVFTVAGSACTPLAGAQVDVWHADAAGVYSDVGSAQGRKFLRGFQVTDSNGIARFTTVYPGWYQGRAVHIHFKVRTFSGGQQASEFTSQWFFDDTLSDAVYASGPYASRGTRSTRNSNDNIYGSNGDELLLTVTQDGQGYAANYDIGLATA